VALPLHVSCVALPDTMSMHLLLNCAAIVNGVPVGTLAGGGGAGGALMANVWLLAPLQVHWSSAAPLFPVAPLTSRHWLLVAFSTE